jgi:ketopantoate reductase
MRVLMVGAGAVGVVLTSALEKTTANEVTYLVRPGRRRTLPRVKLLAAKSGELSVREKPAVVEPTDKLPSADTVIFAVRGDQLDEMIDLVPTLAPTARMATVTPGFDDLAILRRRFPGRVFVQITPSFAAWLEGDAFKLWLPPLVKSIVSWHGGSDDERAFAEELTAAFVAGGVPTRATGEGGGAKEAAMAAGMPVLAALELSGWSFEALARDRDLRGLAARAARESARAMASSGAARALCAITTTPVVNLAMRVAGMLPADMKAMWRAHGPKIAGQTRQMLDAIIARADENRASAETLKVLRGRLTHPTVSESGDTRSAEDAHTRGRERDGSGSRLTP